ncbi:MAG TPA: DUF3551 domain-containing protein [Pseudolabrys sp.]|nr:DUF3551 domain-containing protein [Pseudolabrys sp.]
MRAIGSILFALAVVASTNAFAPAAQAEPYRWCAQYGSGRGGGARNCGFVTWEQCMQTIRGMGGFCEHNLFYTGPEERPVRHKRKHNDD